MYEVVEYSLKNQQTFASVRSLLCYMDCPFLHTGKLEVGAE
jgi:hypothetical protein